MTTGAEIIGSVDKISYFDFFLYLLHDIKGIFIGLILRTFPIVATLPLIRPVRERYLRSQKHF